MVPRVSPLERGKFRERENIRNVQHPAEHESRIRIHFGRNATRGNVAYFIGHGLRGFESLPRSKPSFLSSYCEVERASLGT